MNKRAGLILSAFLLFVFAFAAAVTVQAGVIVCYDGQCQPYDCCYNDNSEDDCSNTKGVWYQGKCNCAWTGDNPNECDITSCQTYCW